MISHEAAQFAMVIDRIARDILAKITPLSDAQLNQPLPIPNANTLFAIATHAVGMGEFWVLTLIGGRTSNRNRSAEFQAAGQKEALLARYQQWIANTHTLLDQLPAETMELIVEPPLEFRSTGGLQQGALTVRDCLLHVVEHTATHLGHIQLTADLLEFDTAK